MNTGKDNIIPNIKDVLKRIKKPSKIEVTNNVPSLNEGRVLKGAKK